MRNSAKFYVEVDVEGPISERRIKVILDELLRKISYKKHNLKDPKVWVFPVSKLQQAAFDFANTIQEAAREQAEEEIGYHVDSSEHRDRDYH